MLAIPQIKTALHIKFLCTFLILTLSAFPAQATFFDDIYVDGRSRSLGMATTAFIDDSSSLYRNPAGLALNKKIDIRAMDWIYGSYSRDVLNAIQTLGSLGGDSQDSTPAEQLSRFDRLGLGIEAHALGFGLFLKSIAGGVHLFDTKVAMRFRTPNLLFASVKMRATTDFGVSLGYGHSFWGNKLRAGLAIRPIMIRAGFNRTLNSNEMIELFSGADALSSVFSPETSGIGMGMDADFGLQGELHPINVYRFGLKPMWGIAFQNMMGNRFPYTLSPQWIGQAPPLQRKINVGVAGRLMGVGAFQPTLSIEYRDILVSTKDSWERLCMGLEILMLHKDWFSTAMRAHYARGNIGGGLGLKLDALEIELGTYAENLGDGRGVGVDRRAYASLSTVF